MVTTKNFIILASILLLMSALTYEYLTIRTELKQEQERYSELMGAYSLLEDRVYYYGLGCTPSGGCSTSLVMKNRIGSYRCWGAVNNVETSECIEPIPPIQYEEEDIDSCNKRTFSDGFEVTVCHLRPPLRGRN